MPITPYPYYTYHTLPTLCLSRSTNTMPTTLHLSPSTYTMPIKLKLHYAYHSLPTPCHSHSTYTMKPTRRAVTTMGSNDLVVGEVHMLGPSCQRYNWHTGRCSSIAFGSSHRRGKTLISKYPLMEKTSGDNLEEKSGVEPLKAV